MGFFTLYLILFSFSQLSYPLKISCPHQTCVFQTSYDDSGCVRQDLSSGCDICLECPMIETLDFPCEKYTCTRKIEFNYKWATYVLLGSNCAIVIMYTLILTCKCRNQVQDGEEIERAVEAGNDDGVETGIANENSIDFNEINQEE